MGGSPKNVTQKSELPDILKKPGQDYINQFQNVASQGIQRTPIYNKRGMVTGYQPADLTQAKAPVYGGQRFADMTSDQNAGMGMIRDAAQQNVGDVAMARGQFGNTANGAYMGYSPGTNPMLGLNNPYLTQAIDQAQGDVTRNYTNAVMPQADSAFARAGAFGGSAWQQAQADNSRAMAGELGRISTNMRMQDYGAQQGLFENAINRSDAAYQQERARQMSAAAALPGLANANMQAGQALYNSGAKQQDFQQRNLDDLYQQWQTAINEPQKRLEILQNGIGAILGNGIGKNTTAPNPNYVSPWQSALSIGGTVAGTLVGGPLGGMAGGTIGGLAGKSTSQ